MPIKTKKIRSERVANIDEQYVTTNEIALFVRHLSFIERVDLLRSLANVMRLEAEKQELDSHTEESRDTFVVAALISSTADYYVSKL